MIHLFSACCKLILLHIQGNVCLRVTNSRTKYWCCWINFTKNKNNITMAMISYDVSSGRPSNCAMCWKKMWLVDIVLFLVSFVYRVAQKFGTVILYALTLPNIDRFSISFHYQNQEKICNNTITKDPTTPQVCRYTTLWNS